ncbi:prohibitin family protein [Deinococcus koreensis]|uniref:Membrane protease subunit, stomatin/prohibitin n=1 Tax=Deinococcus koreensis TaxID=2054903 RepID=A0A2K3V1B5_9DEIO|nr:prohibitin family protein [Deinococcus koreensis]PNY82573.1 membrane protease subunit, stomatin/prohibitin [Deinococcus koreensis]
MTQQGPPPGNVRMPQFQLRRSGRRLAYIAGGVILLLWLLAQGVKVIPAGFVGVVFSAFSGVKPDVLQEGIHFVVPFVDRVNLYDARLQQVTLAHDTPGAGDAEGAIRARSKEGLDITADVTVQFRIDRSKAAILHKELGRNYLETVIRPQVRSKVRDAIGQFSAADIISTKRQQVEASITAALTQVFTRNNLTLDSVLLRELRIPDSIAKAIEQKQAAEQQVEVERNRLLQADISAKRAVVEAQGLAKAAVARAGGEAQALSLRGKALRENPQLIQLTVAEKLSPTIQTVMMPADGNFLIDLKSLTPQAAAAAAKPAP